MSRIETQSWVECNRGFSFNIQDLRTIHQAISSYRPQVTHSEQILAGMTGSRKSQAKIGTWPRSRQLPKQPGAPRGERAQLRLAPLAGMVEAKLDIRGWQRARAALRPLHQHQRARVGQRVQAQPFELARIGDAIQIQV